MPHLPPPSTATALERLHDAGASPISAIKALYHGRGLPLVDAKRLLHESPAWVKEARAAEALWDELEQVFNDDNDLQHECRPDWTGVCVVGEYTLSVGPALEDHFLAIVTRSGHMFSYGGPRCREVAESVEAVLGLRIEYQLLGSTDNASVVLYPPELADRPLLEFTPAFSGFRAFVDRVKNFGMETLLYRLAPEIHQYVGAPSFLYTDC